MSEFEAFVSYYRALRERGQTVPPSVLVEGPGGRYVPLDEHERAKVQVYGGTEGAYVIKDPGPEKLQKLQATLRRLWPDPRQTENEAV
jgi:hypothetical protein